MIMPADHSKHGFLEDIGTDWVALAANGAPIARAATEESVRRAAPDAAEYVTGGKTEAPAPSATLDPGPEEPKPHPESDHDGDGRAGGSKPGDESTVAQGRRKRKPAA